MARQPRIDLPGIAQHLVQRGNDSQPCFFRDIDHIRHLQELRELSIEGACDVHAYVLMTNHVHLLVTPFQSGAISRLMQPLGRQYVRCTNDTYTRTGRLWEGRYKSHLVANDEQLLRCYRYIELNPVRAGMVPHAGDYRWSSYHRNALGRADPLISPHVCYSGLARSEAERLHAYRELAQQARDEDASRFSNCRLPVNLIQAFLEVSGQTSPKETADAQEQIH